MRFKAASFAGSGPANSVAGTQLLTGMTVHHIGTELALSAKPPPNKIVPEGVKEYRAAGPPETGAGERR